MAGTEILADYGWTGLLARQDTSYRRDVDAWFAPFKNHAAVKRFGERQGVRALSRSGYRADEDLAWELASAVLAVLPDIEAIYRSPSEHASLFLAVERTRWVT